MEILTQRKNFSVVTTGDAKEGGYATGIGSKWPRDETLRRSQKTCSGYPVCLDSWREEIV